MFFTVKITVEIKIVIPFISDPNTSDKKFTCKESFWWDGFEIIPPRPKLGLLSNYANRAGEESSEGSSEEYTEEESSSSTSCSGVSDDEGSAESNPAPIQVNSLYFVFHGITNT